MMSLKLSNDLTFTKHIQQSNHYLDHEILKNQKFKGIKIINKTFHV